MKRPRATSFVAPPPPTTGIEQPEPEQPLAPNWRELAGIIAALIAVLDTTEVGPKTGPAQKAHRSAMRRQGEAAAAIGGSEAMQVVMHQVLKTAPDRAEAREAILDMAWAGLPGWRT